MYRIMELKNKKNGLYSFQTEVVNGKNKYVEFTDLKDVDAYIEKLLNDEGYAKADLLVVNVVDYKVSADIQ